MEPRRAVKAHCRLGFLIGLLLSAVALSQPPVAAAAEARDGDEVAAATGSGPVVLRGTRPVTPALAQLPKAASERNRAPSPYLGFQPAPLYGSGWDTEYSTDGLNYTPVVPQ